MTPTDETSDTADGASTGLDDSRGSEPNAEPGRRRGAGWDGRAGTAAVSPRYAALSLGADRGDVVIYDCDNAEAWIQSDRAVSLRASSAEGGIDG